MATGSCSVLLIGGRAHEGDGARDVVADRMRLDVEAGLRRLLVIDAQVERRDRAVAVERELHGHAAALVKHGGDHAAVDHAGLRVADEDGLVGQAGPGLAALGTIDAKSAGAAVERPALRDRFRELFERQRLPIIRRDFRHAGSLACRRDELCSNTHEVPASPEVVVGPKICLYLIRPSKIFARRLGSLRPQNFLNAIVTLGCSATRCRRLA